MSLSNMPLFKNTAFSRSIKIRANKDVCFRQPRAKEASAQKINDEEYMRTSQGSGCLIFDCRKLHLR